MLRVMPVDDEIWTLRDLEVRLADLWMNVCNEQNVDYSFSVHHGMGGMQVQSGNRLHGFAMRERAKKKICVLSSAISLSCCSRFFAVPCFLLTFREEPKTRRKLLLLRVFFAVCLIERLIPQAIDRLEYGQCVCIAC